jgi:hypothetical protein
MNVPNLNVLLGAFDKLEKFDFRLANYQENQSFDLRNVYGNVKEISLFFNMIHDEFYLVSFLQSVPNLFPNLESLELDSGLKMNDQMLECLDNLGKLSKIKSLEFGYWFDLDKDFVITDRFIQTLKTFQGFKKLRLEFCFDSGSLKRRFVKVFKKVLKDNDLDDDLEVKDSDENDFYVQTKGFNRL